MKVSFSMSDRKKHTLLAFSLFFMLILSADSLYAQDPITHQYWNRMAESPKHIDASYSVMECSTDGAEIFLQLFNENPTAQTLDFKLTITDGKSDPVIHTIKDYALDAAAMINPICGSTDYSDLRFAMPDGFNPETVKVEISYQ